METPIPDWLTKKYVSQLSSIAESDLIDYKLTFAIKKNENYCGLLYRLRVETNNSKKSFIVKTLPIGQFALKYVLEAKLFERETSFYTQLLPDLQRLLSLKSNFDFCPAAYNLSGRFDIIVLDDLSYQPSNGPYGKMNGYVLADKSNRFNYDHCNLALKALVKLHVLSWLKAKSDMDLFFNEFKDGIYIDNNKSYVLPYLQCTLSCLKEKIQSWNVDEEYLTKFDHFLSNLWENLKNITVPIPLQNGSNFNVLNHGDFWANNIMFRYDQSGSPIDAKLVDFQNVRFGSPVLDLLYFYHSTAQEDVSYDQLLETYCNYFEDTMTSILGQTVENMPFNRAFLAEESKRNRFFGFFAACTVLQTVLSKPIVNDVDTDQLSVDDVKTTESPLSRMYDGEHFKNAFLTKMYAILLEL